MRIFEGSSSGTAAIGAGAIGAGAIGAGAIGAGAIGAVAIGAVAIGAVAIKRDWDMSPNREAEQAKHDGPPLAPPRKLAE